MKRILLAFLLLPFLAFGVAPDKKTLPIGFAPHEVGVKIRPYAMARSNPPVGPVHSLGEWEESEAVFTLWPNASYFRELARHGRIEVLSTQSDQSWWLSWLSDNGVSESSVHYVDVVTDSIWVRDYGPWWIVDGKGQFGAIDAIYNRPRPNDDKVPTALAKEFNFPLYALGLVHTGGNFYSDGYGDAFSSTLVFEENDSFTVKDVLQRMSEFLGITNYQTSPLGIGDSIEHMDTFGKLVAPDTWVFSQFPADSKFYADSERMVQLLQTLLSPYGTPYKIFRMPMVLRSGPVSGEDYRGYINSFISNKVLYFATYGDADDDVARAVYQSALPGYEIVGVDSDGTEWGDSVHCRSRNLIKRDAIFAFPKIAKWPKDNLGNLEMVAEVLASPGASVVDVKLQVKMADGSSYAVPMTSPGATKVYSAVLPNMKSGGVEFGLYVKDSSGKEKWFPATWPDKGIDVVVP